MCSFLSGRWWLGRFSLGEYPKESPKAQSLTAFYGELQPIVRQDVISMHDGVVIEVFPLGDGLSQEAIRYVVLDDDGQYGILRGAVVTTGRVDVGDHIHCETVEIFRVSESYSPTEICTWIVGSGKLHKPHIKSAKKLVSQH